MKLLSPELGHAENGELVPVAQFDYDALEDNLFDAEDAATAAGLSQVEIDAALKLFDLLLKWVWQNGMKNTSGLQIRSAIVCWIMLKDLRSLNLTQLARGFGQDKQSIGRWVDDFKRNFPQIKTPHMRVLAHGRHSEKTK